MTELYRYDEESDLLDVYFGEIRPAWTIELTDNIMLSMDRQTKQVVCLSLLDFTELIRPTLFGPRSFPLTGLADLPIAERDIVISALLSPPLSRWLDISSVEALPDSPFAVTHLETIPDQVLALVPAAAPS
jgi:hypothetical protein